MTSTTSNKLSFEVIAGNYALPGNQPANCTLVKGRRDALLVDVPFARSEGHRLIARILDSARELRTIYISHDHPDHFFSLDLVTDTFPKAAVLAHPAVTKDMQRSIPLKFARWAEGLGANAPKRGVVPTPVDGNEIEIEGHRLQIIGPMQGDHIRATALWDPDSRTLVAGDLLYNGVFVFLGEHRPSQWDAWIQSLDYLESLSPMFIVAGHSKPGLPDDSFSIEWTRRYIQEFKKLAASAATAQEMAERLRARYPNAVGFPGTDFLIEVPTRVATGEIEPWDE